jgi:hypothetical protein
MFDRKRSHCEIQAECGIVIMNNWMRAWNLSLIIYNIKITKKNPAFEILFEIRM